MSEQEAPSPFLPGTNIQYAWDSTSIGYLKTCPQLYYYHMIEGWQAKAESVHLRFGIEFHRALQDYEISLAAGIKHDDAVHDVLRELLIRSYDWDSDHKTKNRRTLIRTVLWYLEQFRTDPATTVILDNGDPAVELSFKFELDWGPSSQQEPENVGNPDHRQPYILCGHLDRVVEFNDEVYVMDHKTTSIMPSPYYFNQFDPHNQMTLYSLASQIILSSPIRGVIIDATQILVEGSRTVRGFTYRNPDVIQEWVEDLRYWFDLAEGFAVNNHWPKNDTACDKFGGCKFKEICSRAPGVREQFLKSEFEKGEPWNPLKTR